MQQFIIACGSEGLDVWELAHKQLIHRKHKGRKTGILTAMAEGFLKALKARVFG